MPTYRCTYSWVEKLTGTEEALKYDLREATYRDSFSIANLSTLRVQPKSDGTLDLFIPRTLVEEIYEKDEATALRMFLYHDELNNKKINTGQLTIRQVDEPEPLPEPIPAETEAPLAQADF